jgi:hypothetical protein
VQQPTLIVQVVRVARRDQLPGVPGRVSCRNTKRLQEPLLPVGAVVSQRLSGPLARDQDPPFGVAKMIDVMSLALTAAGDQAGVRSRRRGISKMGDRTEADSNGDSNSISHRLTSAPGASA